MQCYCAVPRIRGHPSQRASGWVLICAFLLWTSSTPGVLPSRHSSVPSAPGSTVGTLEAPLSFDLFGFLCHVCCGASLQRSWWLLSLLLPVVFPETPPAAQWGPYSWTGCPWRPSGELHAHHLLVPVALEAPSTSHLFRLWRGPLRRLDVEIKATLCENAVLFFFAICSGWP